MLSLEYLTLAYELNVIPNSNSLTQTSTLASPVLQLIVNLPHGRPGYSSLDILMWLCFILKS